LRLRGDRSGRLERRAVEALGRGAAEVTDTATHVRRVPGLSLPAPQSPREDDARREVPLAWQPIDPYAEQRVHRPVCRGRAVESGGLDPDTVHDVQTGSRMPGVSGVHRGVPGRPVHVLGGEGTGERGWAVGGERRERGEGVCAELVRDLVVVAPDTVQVAAELDAVLRVARQPGELVGELDGPVVGALRRGVVAAEGEGRDVLAAVAQG